MKFVASKSLRETLYRDFLIVLLCLTCLSVVLLATRMFVTDSLLYGFLLWNIFLAWIPALTAWKLLRYNNKSEIRPAVVVWLLVWLLFLPNTFYLVTDFIHLDRIDGISKLFDGSMVFAFSVCGFGLGVASMLAVHSWLEKYVSKTKAACAVAGVIILSSFAIYLGRYLRWNSWDVIVNPFGLLFDVSDRFINPNSHPQTFSTTLLFTLLIGGIYTVSYFCIVRISRHLQRS